MAKILIVGQGPSKSGLGQEALTGLKKSGGALAKLFGLAPEQLHARADCINLLSQWHGKSSKGDKFPLKMAQKTAQAILNSWKNYDHIILLGSNVAKAFGFHQLPLLTWTEIEPCGCKLAIVPHPSGINRWYNDAANKRAATSFLRELFA